MEVLFHVFDNCNMHCPNCHWFSEKVVEKIDINPKDFKIFLKRALKKGINIERVLITGGEPTLWPKLTETINNFPDEITDIRIFSNGSFPEKIKNITRTITYRISLHTQTKWNKIKESIELANKKKWRIKFVGYETAMPKEIPEWFNYPIKINKEQINESKKIRGLVGQEILCKPKKIYIGTDGRAYYCEKGLRTKEDKYAENFSLTKGKIRISSLKCKVDKSCLGNLINEQTYQVLNK